MTKVKSKIDRQKMLELYREGKTPDQIASIFGTKSGDHIDKLIRKELQIKLPVGKIKSLWLAGWGIERIMEECDVTEEQIKEVIFRGNRTGRE